jgi:hypothetical protein
VHDEPTAFDKVEHPPHALSDAALQTTPLVPLHPYVPVHPSLAVHPLPGLFGSVAQPPHALSAGTLLQLTALVPLQP